MTSYEQKSLEALFPKSIDEIIKMHRDECSIRLSSDADFEKLESMVSSMSVQKPIRATIDEWRIICVLDKDRKFLFLTGIHRAEGYPFMTSDIVSVDFASNLVLTKNSLYQLGGKGEGEPERDILLHICTTLHRWGVGEYFGILHIFY